MITMFAYHKEHSIRVIVKICKCTVTIYAIKHKIIFRSILRINKTIEKIIFVSGSFTFK